MTGIAEKEKTMNDKEFKELMRKMERANAEQAEYAKKQYRMSQVCAAANILVLCIVIVCAVIVIPKVNSTFDYMQTVMENLEIITNELAQADMDGMLNHMDSLITSSEQSIADAMDKLNQIDFEKLNEAIEDLAAIIRPLASFFGR